MIESGAAICARLGHPEDCACWLPNRTVTDEQIKADVEWMLRVMSEQEIRAREISNRWEAFVVEVTAKCIELGCSATPTRDPRTPVPIHPGSVSNQVPKKRAR